MPEGIGDNPCGHDSRQRSSRRAGAALPFLVAAILFGAAANAQKAPDAGGADISGVWWATSYSPRIQPAGGGELPFTAAGRAQYEKNMVALKNGTVEDTARTLCTPDGVPRILATPFPFDIIQTKGQITIVYEMNHAIRIVDMTKALAEDETVAILPYYDGHSAGRWDGDTLIIESAGFNEKTFIDSTGAPHSDQLRVTERLRKIDGGKQLEDVVTVSDPVNYAKPWSARFVYDYRPDIRLTDYVCGEPHRDLSAVRGVIGF